MSRKEYKTQNMFPVECFEFRAPQELTSSVLSMCTSLKYQCFNLDAGVETSDDIHQDIHFQELHCWFQSCVDTLHVDFGWWCDRMVVNKTWVNKSTAESHHHHSPHRHPMSYMSGIFYLTEGPPTVFLDPLQQREWGQLTLDGTVNRNEFFYHGGPGGLILFPSWMIHASVPNDSEVDRYSIAFNTFPQGNINAGGWNRPMLNVDVNGWHTLNPLKLSDYARN